MKAKIKESENTDVLNLKIDFVTFQLPSKIPKMREYGEGYLLRIMSRK